MMGKFTFFNSTLHSTTFKIIWSKLRAKPISSDRSSAYFFGKNVSRIMIELGIDSLYSSRLFSMKEISFKYFCMKFTERLKPFTFGTNPSIHEHCILNFSWSNSSFSLFDIISSIIDFNNFCSWPGSLYTSVNLSIMMKKRAWRSLRHGF